MRKTTGRLADGRSIIFYDDTTRETGRVIHDPRPLPPRETWSEIRHDALADDWVVVASHRQSRTFLPPADQCPLCPSADGRSTEIPADDYDVVVFENRFPSLDLVANDTFQAAPGDLEFPRKPGVGRCEVVCYTADHAASFAALPPSRVRTVVDAWADRTVELGEIPEVEQVFCFENRGEEIGVTLHHAHGQVYGYPFVTPRTRRMLESARRHRERTGRGLLADLLAAERGAGTRIVRPGEHWTAYVPAAARWPFEVNIVPHRQVPDLPALGDAERDELAEVHLDVLRRFDALFDRPMPYIAAWHQAPVRVHRELAHLFLQIYSIRRDRGKLKYLAGSESAMDVFINDVAPEEAARRLREAGG